LFPVRTSQETNYVSATELNRLMLFMETVAVYCENRTELTDTVRGQNSEMDSQNVTAGGVRSNQRISISYWTENVHFVAEYHSWSPISSDSRLTDSDG
jgi:hypothetical protein